jgi:hypothetical protein
MSEQNYNLVRILLGDLTMAMMSKNEGEIRKLLHSLSEVMTLDPLLLGSRTVGRAMKIINDADWYETVIRMLEDLISLDDDVNGSYAYQGKVSNLRRKICKNVDENRGIDDLIILLVELIKHARNSVLMSEKIPMLYSCIARLAVSPSPELWNEIKLLAICVAIDHGF